MAANVCEKQLIGKNPDQSLCEDGIFINENFIAVIDGVTSKGKKKWKQKFSSGGYAKEVILDALLNMPREIEVEAFFDTINEALKVAYSQETKKDDISERLRACVVVYSDFHKQIWSVGDCTCMINGCELEKTKKIDETLSNLRSFVNYYYLKTGGTEKDIALKDVGRNAILSFLKMQGVFENDYDTPWGYPVLNGHGFDMRGCCVRQVESGDVVVLASDGYPVLCDTLDASERVLTDILQEDALCYKKFPSTKGVVPGNLSFDDRAYIKFVVL